MKEFPLYRSLRAGIVGTLLVSAPLLLFSRSALGGMYLVFFLVLLVPLALCMAGLCCGSLPMALGLAAALISMYRLLGQAGLLLTCIYLLPIVGAFVAVIVLKAPFWRGCAVMIGVHAASLVLVYVVLQRMTGGSLYTAAGEAAAKALRDWELGDIMLYQLYSTGLIGLKEDLPQTMFSLPEAAREDMLLSVRSLVSTQLERLVPSLIVTQSIQGGVLCLLLPLRFGFIMQEKRQFLSAEKVERLDGEDGDEGEEERKKQKVDFPDIGMPPFNTWFIPRGVGWQVGVALALGYLLRTSATPALFIAGLLLYAAASSVFTIQGAAALNFLQKARGTSRAFRVILPLLLGTTSLLMLLGIFDQINNFRGLRKPREPKEDF